MKLSDVIRRIEAGGGKVFLRYGRYFDSAYSDVLDASAKLGSICISVTTEKLGLGSLPTEEHEQTVARMLAPIVGFVADVNGFHIQHARQSCPSPDYWQAAERLKKIGARDVEFGARGARHHEGVWLVVSIEIDDVQYTLDTRTHGEGPQSEHEFVLGWYMQRLATWFEESKTCTSGK